MRLISKEIFFKSPGKGALVLHMSRWFLEEWSGDAWVYRITP